MCDLWNQMYDSCNQIWVYWNQMCVKIIKYVSYESNLSLSKSNVRKKKSNMWFRYQIWVYRNQMCVKIIKCVKLEIKFDFKKIKYE